MGVFGSQRTGWSLLARKTKQGMIKTNSRLSAGEKSMSETETAPLWRQALQDSNHPLYTAAWSIFTEKMNLDLAAQRLADQKEQVIPFLNTILDTPELYLPTSLGSGVAPGNALVLLGRWQVLEAVPRMLALIDKYHQGEIAHDASVMALREMGPGALEPVLAAAQQTANRVQQITFGAILARIGKGDRRVWAYLVNLFEHQKADPALRMVAQQLLMTDPESGITYLQERLRRGKYNRSLRENVEQYFEMARKGEFS